MNEFKVERYGLDSYQAATDHNDHKIETSQRHLFPIVAVPTPVKEEPKYTTKSI